MHVTYLNNLSIALSLRRNCTVITGTGFDIGTAVFICIESTEAVPLPLAT